MNESPDPPQPEICASCGTTLAGGLCPRCLMADAAQATQAAGTAPGSALPSLEEVAVAFQQLEIIELIGAGGMGNVWCARQPTLDRFVALKLLPATITERDPAFAERFAREGQLLARLHHPNIVTVHDSGRAGDFFYLIMEFVDGVNLRQAMRASRFTAEQALAIVPKICDALQYAHEEGVLHRDIKPENILLDAKGRVKLVDFGIAKLMAQAEAAPTGGAVASPAEALTLGGTALGTPQYMAPEQRERPADVDHRADIYSLGVVFYELLTGELPQGQFAPPSERSDADPRLDGIVQQALEKQRDRRQGSVGEFRTQVDTVMRGAGPAAPVFQPTYRSVESWEYKSARTLFGLPLVHVAIGMDPATRRPRVARGVFACGGLAEGVFAVGGRARGVFAFGAVATGIVAMGGLSFGVMSMGGIALGLLLAFGGMAAGPVATGGAAVGYFASGGAAWGYYAQGGLAIGEYALGDTTRAAHVVQHLSEMPVVLQLLVRYMPWMCGAYVPLIAILTLLMVLVPMWARRKAMAEGQGNEEPAPGTMPPRFSRTAILGFCGWVIAFTMLAIAEAGRRLAALHAGPDGNIHAIRVLLIAMVAGLPALAGMALGWRAVRQIRRSKGALCGMALAVFDVLLLPLVLLDGMLAGLWKLFTGPFVDMYANPSVLNDPSVHPGFFTWLANELQLHDDACNAAWIIAAIIVDLLIVLAVWRAVKRPLDAQISQPPSSRWRIVYVGVASIALIVFAAVVIIVARGTFSLIAPLEAASAQPAAVVATAAYIGDLQVYAHCLGTVGQAKTGETEVVFSIPETLVQQVVPKLRAKQPLVVEAYAGDMSKRFGTGFLQSAADQIDVSTGTLECRATLEADRDVVLLPNTFVNISLLLETKHGATLLPVHAVQRNGLGPYVYLIQPNDTVTMRTVTLGTTEAGIAEITQGLSAGDRVVLEGPKMLPEGSLVRYPPVQPPTPATTTANHAAGKEVLEAQLEQARAVAARQTALYNAGTIDAMAFEQAKDKVAVLQAELAGDAVEVARVGLEAARRQWELASRTYDAGVMPADEHQRFKAEVAVAEARLREAEARAALSAAPTLSFGPVRERVLPSGVPCCQQYFQFHDGEYYTVGNGPGTQADEAAYDQKKIDDAGGVDMSAISGDEGIQIVGRGCIFTRDVDDLKWDTLTPEQVVKAMQHASFVEGVVAPKKGDFPITYLFKTARGEAGLMEVLGVVDDARDGWKEKGMKFRYKMVRGDKAPNTPAGPVLAFGPANNGLQAALELTPGEPMKLRFHIRNVSDHLIAISGMHLRTQDDCLIEDLQGRPVAVRKPQGEIKSAIHSGGFRPGQVAVFDSAGLTFQPPGAGNETAYAAGAGAGKYSVRFRLHLPGADYPLKAETHNWQGELETAPVAVEIKAAAPLADDSLSLEQAVNDFNKRYQQEAAAAGQQPLTVEAVLAAIRWAMQDRPKLSVTNETFAALGRLIETRVLPKKFELELLTGYEPNDVATFDVWSVRLRIPGTVVPGGTTCIMIHEQQLGSHVIGEEERKVIHAWQEKARAEGGIVFGPETEEYRQEREAAAAMDAKNKAAQPK